MEKIFLEVLNMSMTASLLIGVVLLVRLLLKKAPRWSVCLLWAFVGIKLIFPIKLESFFSLIPNERPIPQDIMIQKQPMIDTGIPVINQTVNPVIVKTFAPTVGDSANPLQVVTSVAGIVWVIGIVLLLIYALISFYRLRRKVRPALKLEKNIFLCDDIETPFILGVVKPKIYIPSGLTETEMRHVLAHEKAHIKRKDFVWKPLGFSILAVHWFNPLVWISYLFLCKDIELACDEKAMKGQDMEEFISYSQTLLSCSITRRNILICPLAFGEVSVKERIKHVLHYKKPAFWVVLLSVVACVVVGICFLTNPKQSKNDNGSGASTKEDQLTQIESDSELLEINMSEADKQKALEEIDQELQNAVNEMEDEKQEIASSVQNSAANGFSRDEILEYLAALPDDTEGLVNAGCFVITYNVNYGTERLWDFQDKYQKKEPATLTIGQYTVEGDIVLEYLFYDGEEVTVISDSRRDKWAGNSDQVTETTLPYFSVFEWNAANGDIYDEIVLHRDADFTHEDMMKLMASSQMQTDDLIFYWIGSVCIGNTHAEIDESLSYHEVETSFDESTVLYDRNKIAYLILTDAYTGESREYSVLDSSNGFNELMDCIYCLDVAPNKNDDAYRSGKKYILYLCDEEKNLCQTISPYQDAVRIDYLMYDGTFNGTTQQLLLKAHEIFCNEMHVDESASHETEHDTEQTSGQHTEEQHTTNQTHHTDDHKNHH